LKELRLSVTGAKADTSFCCGGSVAIKPFAANAVMVDSKPASPPVILHWDQPDRGSSRMVFGDEKTSSAEFQAHIRNMCSSCQAATFGRQGQDDYDATYREALKLEPSQFTINFHPHDYGIPDDLAQILLPPYPGAVIGKMKTCLGPCRALQAQCVQRAIRNLQVPRRYSSISKPIRFFGCLPTGIP
jgi:hypothetical protein